MVYNRCNRSITHPIPHRRRYKILDHHGIRIAPLLSNFSHRSIPTSILSLFFLIHYANRALISPLLTPSRNKSHIVIPPAGSAFNTVNGFLMATYLSSPAALSFLRGAFASSRFWVGLSLALVGLAGNIAHDETLLNIRRNTKKDQQSKQNGEHYAIPYGLLFSYISFPNYFCEWIEWAGFALAASPLPSFASGSAFLATINPPWVFLLSEILLMSPRALKGHKWYKKTFEDYPKERKAVVPFLI